MATPGRIQIVGGGGHALVVADAARSAGWQVAEFWDDDPEAPLGAGVRRAGSVADLADTESDLPLIIAIGGLATRRAVIDQLGPRPYATIIHPRAIVSPDAAIGAGTLIGPGAIINPRAVVGAHGILNSGTIVEHDCAVGDNVHLAPRTVLGGGVSVGAETLIGLGAVVLPQVRIGARCVIAAGAVVTQNIPDRTTAIGVPAVPRPRGGVATHTGDDGAGI